MTLYDYVGRHTPLNVSIVGFMRHSCVGHDALAWPVRLMKLARGSVVECCSDVTFDVTTALNNTAPRELHEPNRPSEGVMTDARMTHKTNDRHV